MDKNKSLENWKTSKDPLAIKKQIFDKIIEENLNDN